MLNDEMNDFTSKLGVPSGGKAIRLTRGADPLTRSHSLIDAGWTKAR